MNDFEGLLSSDYGFKGKSAPMASSKPNKSSNSSSNIPFNFDVGGSKTPPSSSDSPLFDDHDTFFGPNRKSFPNEFSNLGGFNDVFSGGRPQSSAADFENIFGGRSGPSYSSVPVFDKPVFDDEDSTPAKYNDIFSSPPSASSSAKKADAFDDLLGGIGLKETQAAGPKGADKGRASFDDLLPGFGGTGSTAASKNRDSFDATKNTSHVTNDPFVVLESTSPNASSSSTNFNNPLEEIGKVNNSNKKKGENTAGGGVFDDVDPLEGFGKSMPAFSADVHGRQKDGSPLGAGAKTFETQMPRDGDVSWKSSVRSPERVSSKKMPVDDYQESPQSVFEMPSVSAGSHRSVRNTSSFAYRSSGFRESNCHGHAPSDENIGSSDDIWLTVSEIPLFTQPTAAPPPSRPPPRPARFSKAESRSFPASHAQKNGSKYSSSSGSMPYFQSQKSESARAKGSFASSIDELEDFVMGRNHSDVDGSSDVPAGEDFGTNSVAAAAMKDAMDKAETKFRHVRGARERDGASASRSREAAQLEKEAGQDSQERKLKEHLNRLEQAVQQGQREEKRQREEEERRRIEREQEEKEREKRRIEREREFARQAVDRAAREARERAAAEARARAERAAVQKAQAEARERAERGAVQRAQAEARERAAAEARERAEKAAAEARERARAEAREKEACERTAAAAAGASQQDHEDDLESFFSTGSCASSAPRPRATSSASPTHFQTKPAAEVTRTSVDSSSNMRKASSSANIVDDLSSIFGGPPSSGEFQEIEGESEERRRARLERQQRTQERAAKALAEKNARDLEVLREQAERHVTVTAFMLGSIEKRIAEILDAEIKRWAAGKEGNLRALLSTLEYVLWPESGWQPVSLTDMITAVAVKKVYRKATLCIHPDKVQQKGATLQQKYVAEKVFDILKEAWNKFNSEELF